MAIKLYGISGSRALRSIWAIEEIGCDYELVPTNFMGDSKKPDYLKINPNGRIPALVDGDVTIFESMAINLYLAKKYGDDLYPRGEADEAHTWQWSVWGMTELEPPLMQMVLHKVMLPEAQRKPENVTKAEQDIERPLKVLDHHLADRKNLLGASFTIADLNVAAVLSMASFVGYEGWQKHAHVKRWLEHCMARPSLTRAQKAGS